MSSLVLDASALVGVDRGNRDVIALLAAAREAGLPMRTNANVVAQVWRDGRGRQASLARFLHCVEVESIDEAGGRRIGELLALARSTDVVDASVVLLARNGDRITTSERRDIEGLLQARGVRAAIVDV